MFVPQRLLWVHPGTVLGPLARSCLGFVKALLCDDFFGQHKNLFVVAAANPYREEEQLLPFVQVSSPANNDWMDESKIFENELSLTFRIVLVPQAGLKVFVLVPEALSYFVLQEKSEDHVLGGSTTVMRDFFQAIQVVSLSEPDAAF